MPEACRFYGIVISIYYNDYNDHGPPHFHARYGSDQAMIAMDNLTVLQGRLPPRAHGLVIEWAASRNHELRAAWAAARRMDPMGRIAPLD